MLLVLLLLVAALSALRVWIMAAFERRVFARVVAEVTLRAVHAQDPFFADANRGDLFNRFFDLVVVQKAIPSLVIGAFTIVLQAAVGLTITSFYHPFFLAFNAVLVGTVVLIWLLWQSGAITGGNFQREETVVEGLENMPDAFLGLFSGQNKGKMLVKL